MLVLSRKPGEQLCIGDNITITVLSVHGGVMKLGINAPQSVRVLRGELQPWPPETKPSASPDKRARAGVFMSHN